ncbi:hypothetical protein BYT27DRAFT_7193587 [Phlegmacium glaucopus]|nr:hypothetical protein BYT27DRAFT_7193587 [Phlegmacium glaucopus]
MANFSHSMPLENPYVFVDPFRPSLNFSLNNVITTRRQEAETTIDNIPLPTPNILSQRYRYMQASGSVISKSRRESSSFYYIPSAPPTVPEKPRSQPASSSRNTFGIEATGARNDRSHDRSLSPPSTMLSPRPRVSTSFSPPRSDSESLPFGIEATGARNDRSCDRSLSPPSTLLSPRPRVSTSCSPPPHPILSPRPCDSTSCSPPRSDRESHPITLPYESADRNSQLHEAANIGGSTNPNVYSHMFPIFRSGAVRSQESHRRNKRKSRAEAKSSRDPEITLENRRSSPVYIPPTSSNAISYYKPPTRSSEVALPSSSRYIASYDLTSAIKHEYPIPSTHPASQPPLIHHPSPNLAIYILAFLLDTLPRQIYLHLMLRLPHLYFTHVIRIFEDAEMSMPEIKQMALEASSYLKGPTTDISKALYFKQGSSNPRYDNLSSSWGAFIDSLIKEWKTLNIISVLLLSAILTILQIQSAANDPVTRYTALLSMICALMSLLYGCIYIIRFGTMRSTCKAAEFAHEAQKTTTGIFWNVWVLLAMPAIWLAWSMIFFVVAIMAFVWRTGTIDDVNQTPITSHDALAPRIILTIVLSLGLVYLILIAGTFRRYGTMMDRAWRNHVLAWVHGSFVNHGHTHIDPSRHSYQESLPPSSKPPFPMSSPIHSSPQDHPGNVLPPTPPVVVSPDQEKPRGRSTSIKPLGAFVSDENPHHRPPASQKRMTKPTKIFGLVADDYPANVIPSKETLASCQMTIDDWEQLSSQLRSSQNPNQISTIHSILQRWNQTFFKERGAHIALCEEFGVPGLKHAIYHFPWKFELPPIDKDP